MEAAQRRYYWPGEPRPGQEENGTARIVSTPSRSRGGCARIDTTAGSEERSDRGVDSAHQCLMQNQSRERKTARRELKKPNVLYPAMEVLPLLTHTTIAATDYVGIDY